MLQDACPVVARVPGDFGWGVDLDGHDLADPSALDDDDSRSDAAVVSTPLLAAPDVINDEWVADISSRNNMSRRDGESEIDDPSARDRRTKKKLRLTDGATRSGQSGSAQLGGQFGGRWRDCA